MWRSALVRLTIMNEIFVKSYESMRIDTQALTLTMVEFRRHFELNRNLHTGENMLLQSW